MLDDLIDRVQGYYLEQPERLVTLGRLFLGTAFALVFLGVLGNLLVVAPTAVLRINNAQAAAPALGQAYPDLWWLTWLVPESLIGAVPALLLASAGVWCIITGRAYMRALR